MPRLLPHLSLTALLLALAMPTTAQATTFCVPSFHAACPNNGTNVVAATLDAAMTTDATDAVADTVRIAAGTLTDPESFEATGSDDLEIIGAGKGSTILTTSSADNIYVVNLATFAPNRAITMRDLTIRVPAGTPDNQGSAIQLRNDTLDGVDLESANTNTQTALVAVTGGTFRRGTIRGVAGGTWGTGVSTSVNSPIGLTVEQSTVQQTAVAAFSSGAVPRIRLRRSVLENASQAAVYAANGAGVDLESVVITASGGSALQAGTSSAASSSISAEHVTILGQAANPKPALDVTAGGGTGDATISLRNSIVRGFATTVKRTGGSGANGDALLLLSDATMAVVGQNIGNGAISQTNVANADPLFTSATNLALLPGSPAIDAGSLDDPVTVDLNGAPRPVDGDGDGVARTDRGAFEYQPPAAQPQQQPAPQQPSPGTTAAPASGPPTSMPPAADTTAPVVALKALRRGRLRVTLSERATVTIRFSRKGRRSVTVRRTLPAGTTTLAAPRALRAGRWKVTATAKDAAGNASATRTVALTVRR